MIDGILLINKEVGITSYDVIRRLKKILPKGQKIGHAGTLDPFASGLLILLLGKCTKRMNDILQMEKEYLVKAEFGYSTDTQDITGEIIEKGDLGNPLEKELIEKIIGENLVGKISQTPPQFSAKKINGRKAYEYARKNKKVNLAPKEIFVKSFNIEEYAWPFAIFRIICSSGTYIRTLINDLGKESKYLATAVELKRTRIGKFTLDDSIESKDLIEGVELNLVNI